MEEAKPCPFCGGEYLKIDTDDSIFYQGGKNAWYCIRQECGVSRRNYTSTDGAFDTAQEEEAIKGWNMRVDNGKAAG